MGANGLKMQDGVENIAKMFFRKGQTSIFVSERRNKKSKNGTVMQKETNVKKKRYLF